MRNNNHKWLKRCFNCMEQIDAPDAECTNCGWDNHNRENGNAALEQTVLNGQYIIGKIIGRSGFGITYMGFDLVLDRRVVIKEYFPVGLAYRLNDAITVQAYTEAKKEFQSGLKQALEESRSIAKLGQIPNIMQVYNAFLENGTVYMVMEYVDGNSLWEEVKRSGKLNWRAALHLIYPIMDALEKIHDKGLIHGDISPENVIRRKENGNPVLLGLGSTCDTPEDYCVTLKPGYAALEQYSADGKQDRRVDEYALCATLYFLITGSIPISADTRLYANKKLKRPSEYTNDIPADIEKILLKGMKIDRGDRYLSVRELHEAFLKAEQEAGKSGKSRKKQTKYGDFEYGRSKPKKKEKTGAANRIAGILLAMAAAVACLIGFLMFGNLGRERDAVKRAAKVKTDDTFAPTSIPTPTSTISENIDSEDLPKMKSFGSDYRFNVLGSEVSRSEVTEVKIESSLANAPENAWDVSEMGDGSVLAWVSIVGEEEILTIAGEGGVRAPEDLSELFADYYNLQSADLNGFDTSNVIDMSDMFMFCYGLENINMSGFNTSNVTDMNSMFFGCDGLVSIDISGFDTSNVKDMKFMFASCDRLESINMSNFDTSNVTDMSNMFEGCENLTNVDISNFNTSNVTNISHMFYHCSSLSNLNLSNFDTSNVIDMSNMFSLCESLKSIDVSGFNTSKVQDMSHLFDNCKSLTNLEVSSFDTSNVQSMSNLFNNCENLTNIDVSNFNTPYVTDMSSMFSGCKSLTNIDVSRFDTSNVTDMSFMFSNCRSLISLDVRNFDTSNVTNMRNMFYRCESLASIDVSNFDTLNVTEMNNMFYYCKNLTSIGVDSFVTSNANTSNMFLGCDNL